MPRTLQDTVQELIHKKKPDSYEAMSLAVSMKEARRARKQQTFNCVVLCYDNHNSNYELECFLKFLEKEKVNLPNNTRFQAVYKMKCRPPDVDCYHWLAMDILIQDKELQFFLIDPYNVNLVEIYEHFEQWCPTSSLRYSTKSLQFDDNCSTFAFDFVARMAKIPALHEALNKNQKAKPGQIYTPAQQWPDHFGPLLRNTQSFTFLNEYILPNKKMMGNDTQTLSAYLADKQRVGFVDKEGQPKKRNNSILVKREHINAKAIAHAATLTEAAFKAMVGLSVEERLRKALNPKAIANAAETRAIAVEAATKAAETRAKAMEAAAKAAEARAKAMEAAAKAAEARTKAVGVATKAAEARSKAVGVATKAAEARSKAGEVATDKNNTAGMAELLTKSKGNPMLAQTLPKGAKFDSKKDVNESISNKP